MKRKIIILATSLLISAVLHAQKVTDVQFDQEGSRVKVTYTLSQRVANISLSLSTNGGATYIRLRKVEGDVGERIEPGNHVIYWNAGEEMEEIESDQVVFRVDCEKATPLRKTFIVLNGTYHLAPQWGWGLTFGQVKKVGWYVSLLTNGRFNFTNDGIASSSGTVNGQYPFYTNIYRKSLGAVNAGINLRLGEPVWLYLGLGYGNRQYAVQTTDELWYAQSSVCYSGVSFDMGVTIAINKFLISAGAHSLGFFGFEYCEFKGGIGICF